LQYLICIDQLIQVKLFSIPFILTGKGKCPNADETISSVVGRKAVKGRRWALITEKAINKLFSILGEEDHCRSSIEHWLYYDYSKIQRNI